MLWCLVVSQMIYVPDGTRYPNSADQSSTGDDVALEITEDYEPDVVKAYGYHGVTRLSYEVLYEGRGSANLYENAETVAFIAVGRFSSFCLMHMNVTSLTGR